MFRGNHPATVDAKGRLKVPAGFLELLKQFGTQVYITSLDGGSASIYPISVWEEIESRVHDLGALHPSRLRFTRATSAYGQQAELDAQNRLLLPQNLRTDANLVGKVDVLGLERRLEVWNHATLFSQIEENRVTDEDLTYVFPRGG